MRDNAPAPVHLMAAAQSLPAAARIAAELGQKLQDAGTDLNDVARLIKRDSALTARLIRLANSVQLAQQEPVVSVENAASLLGFRELRRLVGALSMQQLSEAGLPAYGVGPQRFRENALLVALLMEELAPAAKLDSAASYTLGLFRTLGKLALNRFGDGLPDRAEPWGSLGEWEERHFGITGNHAGAIILQNWFLSDEIVAAVKDHYMPMASDGPLTHLLNLAAGLAEEQGFSLPGEAHYWRPIGVRGATLGITEPVIVASSERAVMSFERIGRSLG